MKKKPEFIPSSDMKCPKSTFLLIIIVRGESGKTISIYTVKQPYKIHTVV